MIINEMILEGVVALSTGENPRLIEDKLISFLSDVQKNKRPHAGREPAGAG
jgi:chemotaxis protein MotA